MKPPTLYSAVLARQEHIMDHPIIKTRQQWAESHQNLGQFLSPGDLVDEDFIEWARDIMPPACWTSRMIQIGEPHSHIGNRATYATFHIPANSKYWAFAGYCFRTESTQAKAA